MLRVNFLNACSKVFVSPDLGLCCSRMNIDKPSEENSKPIRPSAGSRNLEEPLVSGIVIASLIASLYEAVERS